MTTYKQLQERINMAKAKMGDVIKDFQDSDAPQFKGKSDEKRRQMAIAAKLSNEEVELDEKFQVHYYNKKGEHVNSSSIFSDKVKADAHAKRGNSIDQAGGKYVVKKLANEEVEELEELSNSTMGSYTKKAAADFDARKPKMGYDGQLKKMQNRKIGVNRALDKMYGEEVELDEGRMKEIAMDINSMDDKGFKAKHRKSKQEMQSALKSEELKGDQHKIDANKNGKVDGHDFKLLRSKKKVEESSDLKPFIVVHAKHGKFETHAGSTYEAAKNAAAHWKTKKGTAGMDVHRADVTHSTQHVG